MGWMYLITAGILEIGWPVGLKMAQNEQYRWQGILLAVVLMFASGVFLFMAQKTVPMGTAYAVWTGIGAVGTVLVGILVFKEPATFWRLFFITTLICSIVGLKFVSSH